LRTYAFSEPSIKSAIVGLYSLNGLVTIEAREVRVVTTRTAQAPRPRTTRGHRNSEAGQTTTQAATTTDQTPPRTTRSTALQLLDLI
jgi:hypothetical protein